MGIGVSFLLSCEWCTTSLTEDRRLSMLLIVEEIRDNNGFVEISSIIPDLSMVVLYKVPEMLSQASLRTEWKCLGAACIAASKFLPATPRMVRDLEPCPGR